MSCKIGIFGSCISRDAFEFVHNDFTPGPYVARNSIISAVSKPLGLPSPEYDKIEQKFYRYCFKTDFEKLYFGYLADRKPDFLLIDLIDERNNLLRAGESIVTDSDELETDGFLKKISVVFEPIQRNSDITHEMWKKSFDQFIARISLAIPKERILINKAAWAESYVDNGTVKKFAPDIIEKVKLNNAILNKYYNHIHDFHSYISLIDLTALAQGDAQHKWNLAPYHYSKPYYHALIEALDEFTC